MKFQLSLIHIKSLALAAGLSFSLASFSQDSAPVKLKTAAGNSSDNTVNNPGENEVEVEVLDEAKETKTPTAAPRKNTSSDSFNKHWIGLGIGQTFLFGKYDNYGENEIGWDLFYAYTASYSFDFLMNFHFQELEKSNKYIKTTGLTFDIKSRVFDFDAFSPFVVGGLGLYNPKAKGKYRDTYYETEGKIVLGLNFGGGFDLKLNDQFSFGFLGIVHAPFKSKQDNKPDLKGYYLKLMMTAMYAF